MASKEKEHPCACEYQIIWYYDKPTIIACEECERTLHHGDTICPVCKSKPIYFVREEEI